MEQVNFANNLDDYFKVGGKVKYIPSNVVTKEGTPVVGKKLETLPITLSKLAHYWVLVLVILVISKMNILKIKLLKKLKKFLILKFL